MCRLNIDFLPASGYIGSRPISCKSSLFTIIIIIIYPSMSSISVVAVKSYCNKGGGLSLQYCYYFGGEKDGSGICERSNERKVNRNQCRGIRFSFSPLISKTRRDVDPQGRRSVGKGENSKGELRFLRNKKQQA